MLWEGVSNPLKSLALFGNPSRSIHGFRQSIRPLAPEHTRDSPEHTARSPGHRASATLHERAFGQPSGARKRRRRRPCMGIAEPSRHDFMSVMALKFGKGGPIPLHGAAGFGRLRGYHTLFSIAPVSFPAFAARFGGRRAAPGGGPPGRRTASGPAARRCHGDRTGRHTIRSATRAACETDRTAPGGLPGGTGKPILEKEWEMPSHANRQPPRHAFGRAIGNGRLWPVDETGTLA